MNLVFVEYGSGRVGIEVVGERVGVGAVTVVCECAIRATLGGGLPVRNTSGVARDVGLPLARAPGGARRKLRQHEADVPSGQSDQSLVKVVRQGQGHRRCAAARWYSDAGYSDVDQLGRIDRYTVTGRRSRRSRRPGWSGCAIRARGAIAAFTASKKEAQEDERCNSARAVQEACHFWSP